MMDQTPEQALDARPPEQERLWQKLRALDPPAGAKQRVLEAVEARLQVRPRRLVAPAAAVLAAALLVLWWARPDERDTPSARVIRAAHSSQNGAALASGARLGSDPVEIAAGGHLHVDTGAAEVQADGPALLEIRPDMVALRRGEVAITGDLAVEGSGCIADVSGRCTVSARSARLQFRVFAGSARPRPAASTSCEVIEEVMEEVMDLDEVSETAAVRPGAGDGDRDHDDDERGAPGAAAVDSGRATDVQATPTAGVERSAEAGAATRRRPPAVRSRVASEVPEPKQPAQGAPAPSQLAEQVSAYWTAIDHRKADPGQALKQLRSILSTWPRTSLRPEIELAIYDTLVVLGRTREARKQARRILDRDPGTPRAGDLRRVLEEGDDD